VAKSGVAAAGAAAMVGVGTSDAAVVVGGMSAAACGAEGYDGHAAPVPLPRRRGDDVRRRCRTERRLTETLGDRTCY